MKKNLLKISGITLGLVVALGMSGCASTGGNTAASGKALEVGIAADMPSVDVMHNGKTVTIMRNQN